MGVALLSFALAVESAAAPQFDASSGPIPADVVSKMKGASWRAGCPVPIRGLAYVKVRHWGYDGAVHVGELIVAEQVAPEVVAIFGDLFRARFPIEKMRLVDEYGGSDEASMQDNNTSSFNCRWVTGKKGVFSRHSYGRAIDINPKTNPYVSRSGRVVPAGGEAYADRSRSYVGGIAAGDACHRAFVDRGWAWGGAWRSVKDYQHFEKKESR